MSSYSGAMQQQLKKNRPELTILCLLPTGISHTVNSWRKTTLAELKEDLWHEARKDPLFPRLVPRSKSVFTGVTTSGSREHFYDESRCIGDLDLFRLVLRLVEVEGDRSERELNYEIGMAMGGDERLLTALDETTDREVTHFRNLGVRLCQELIEERSKNNQEELDLYSLSVDSVTREPLLIAIDNPSMSKKDLPYTVDETGKVEKFRFVIWHSGPGDSESFESCSCTGTRTVQQGHTLEVLAMQRPDEVIQTGIVKKARKLSLPSDVSDFACQPMLGHLILKAAGRDMYLFGNEPLIYYKSIRKALYDGVVPQFMLMSKRKVFSDVVQRPLITPSFTRRQGSICGKPSQSHNQQRTVWDLDDFFKLQIRSANTVHCSVPSAESVTIGLHVYVALYFGIHLIQQKRTLAAQINSPSWFEDLEMEDMYIKDMPKDTQLCFALCCVTTRKAKEEVLPLGWGNLRLIDAHGHLIQGDINFRLNDYPSNYDSDAIFYPHGANGPATDHRNPAIVLRFLNYSALFTSKNKPVTIVFPERSMFRELADFEKSQSNNADNVATAEPSPDDVARFDELILAAPRPILEGDDAAFIWRMRLYCRRHCHMHLPCILDSVPWTKRGCVAHLYDLLDAWPMISPTNAVQLLDLRYPDSQVRAFAIRCLERLSDEEMEVCLLPLVQALKFEPFLDTHLLRFLLRRSLLCQRIGHAMFWMARSELYYASEPDRMRYAVLLELYCRGCGSFLSKLLHQVDAVKKMTLLNEQLIEAKDDWPRSLDLALQEKDIRQALENFESPIDSSHILGSLSQDSCRLLSSARRPLRFTWGNELPLADLSFKTHELIFKMGDDLRQDMLTISVLRLMDSVWKRSGRDYRLTPYSCVSTGGLCGVIEVVRDAMTIHDIQMAQSRIGALKGNPNLLYRWLREQNDQKPEQIERAVSNFTRSCAGYCVATFVLGIKDRHQSNIMLTKDGHIFHIDFGHFLGHYKKKFGISRERVPFVLNDDFLRVIAHGADNPRNTEYFNYFKQLCVEAYTVLHQHASLFVTLFTMCLCMNIPELQRPQDVDHLSRTLAVGMSEQEAVKYFNTQLNIAYEGAWTTKVDWFCHMVKRRIEDL